MRGFFAAGFAMIMFWLVVVVAGVSGWIENIVQIVHHVSDPITGMFVLRCVGIIIAPLGAILGIIDFL